MPSVNAARMKRAYAECRICGQTYGKRDVFCPWNCETCLSSKELTWKDFRKKAIYCDFYVGRERLDYEIDRETASYVIPEVDDLGSGKDRIYGRWIAVKKGKIALEVYMSCPICGAINDVTDCAIQSDGECECFHCALCTVDLDVKLGGWRPYRLLRRGKVRKFMVWKGEVT